MNQDNKEEDAMQDARSTANATAFFEKFIQKFFLSQVLLPASTTQCWASALERVHQDPQLSAMALNQARSLVAEGWPAQDAAFFWAGIVQDVVNVSEARQQSERQVPALMVRRSARRNRQARFFNLARTTSY